VPGYRTTLLVAEAMNRPRITAIEAVTALTELGVRPLTLIGDGRQTAERIAPELGIDEVLAEVLPGDKAATVAELHQGRNGAMVGDGVNDAPATASTTHQRSPRPTSGSRSAPVPTSQSRPPTSRSCAPTRSMSRTAVSIGRGTLRKMRRNLGWAIGYNLLALPLAAGVFEPRA
jgi:Cu2+-exporting ATPase